MKFLQQTQNVCPNTCRILLQEHPISLSTSFRSYKSLATEIYNTSDNNKCFLTYVYAAIWNEPCRSKNMSHKYLNT